jgi:hypothetical protein
MICAYSFSLPLLSLYVCFLFLIIVAVQLLVQRNTRGWTQEQLQKMATEWEETPPYMPILNVSVCH